MVTLINHKCVPFSLQAGLEFLKFVSRITGLFYEMALTNFLIHQTGKAIILCGYCK